jgi:beta-fructofuranosidase
MEWSREKKYRRIEDASTEEIRELESRVSSCPWRQTFHIQPITGLLNDPNGFSFFNGEYHLFYQWFPLGPVHGLKYWYHTKSKDLVNWENVGIGLAPDVYFDSYGVYSGSAVEHDEKLYLIYTGNTRDENWVRHSNQCIAVMDKQYDIIKLDKPVIDKIPYGYTEHFRDPKVWQKDNRFYAVIGAQRADETGSAVLYSSKDLIEWSFEGEMKTLLDTFGYMWECPDYFEFQNQGVFIFCPQGLEPEGDKYRNVFQTGYVLGEKLDYNTKTLHHGSFTELDRGFDFYAPQTMLSPDGRRILVGWMGSGEVEYPTDKNGWAHCLTLPRELSIKNSKLIQQPVQELKVLRKESFSVEDTLSSETKSYPGFNGITYELICEFENKDSVEFGVEIRANEDEKTVVKYDAIQRKIILDRSLSGEEVGAAFGTIRVCEFDSENIKLHIFVDTSSVEVFINDGREVFTSRIFPSKDSKDIRFFALSGQVSFKAVKWDY